MEDPLKRVKSIKDSGLLLNGITETVKNEVNEVFGTLGANLLGNMLAGRGFIRVREGTIRAGYGSKKL